MTRSELIRRIRRTGGVAVHPFTQKGNSPIWRCVLRAWHANLVTLRKIDDRIVIVEEKPQETRQ